ncbi:MAG: hypothetical protein R8K49_08195 [Mariprofundaceae bacterium]
MLKINPEQADALTELINIGVGKAAATLNSMVGHSVELNVPYVSIINKENLIEHFPYNFESASSISMNFKGNFDGKSVLLFPKEAANILAASLTDEPIDSPDIDELRAGTLTEVGNILINGIMGSMANMLNTPLHYSVPDYNESNIETLISLDPNLAQSLLIAETSFCINDLKVSGSFLLFFQISSFDTLLTHIDKALT